MTQKITWVKVNGRYLCKAKECGQWTENGCLLRKVGLTCDNGECEFNVSPIPGVYQCGCMDVHLDSDGKCLGFKVKGK
uniref:Uncharacterized protein n=1 Tax=viral metagenome TaxID=1070528 RepID=A0A6M3IEW4_9ZZZZ